ncbi:MAG: glycosyltransferase [Desulfobulbus sp.]|nr:glycosyltransferase [Desulfobulbus sp.]
MDTPGRSFVIPVLHLDQEKKYNIFSLLDDLRVIPGEIICIFNSEAVCQALAAHGRIDKYIHNSVNIGVSRSWNAGINMSESEVVFILNADLHVQKEAVEQLEHHLLHLPDAVLVGPEGTINDYANLEILQYFKKGNFDQPFRTHDISGFFFALHRPRFLEHKLLFDVRYSPCFMEEWDMGMQVLNAGLACYVVPVHGYEHEWGISGTVENVPINYMGRIVHRHDILEDNRRKFLEKWFPHAG